MASSLSNHRKQRMEPLLPSLNMSVSDGLFTSTAQVHIRVLGANLCNPAFSQSTYVAEVRKTQPLGQRQEIHVRARMGIRDVWADQLIPSSMTLLRIDSS